MKQEIAKKLKDSGLFGWVKNKELYPVSWEKSMECPWPTADQSFAVLKVMGLQIIEFDTGPWVVRLEKTEDPNPHLSEQFSIMFWVEGDTLTERLNYALGELTERSPGELAAATSQVKTT